MSRRKYCAGCKQLLPEHGRYYEDVCSKECAIVFARQIRIKLALLGKSYKPKEKPCKGTDAAIAVG